MDQGEISECGRSRRAYPSLEFLRKNNHIAKVGLGDQRDALNAFKVFCPGKCDAHPVPGVRAVGKKIFALHRVYAEVLDSELLIFAKMLSCAGVRKGSG